MNIFDYYKYGRRLIRVNEECNHFRDITPEIHTPLAIGFLRERFPDGFEFIASYDVTLDNDYFIHMYNTFKPTIKNALLGNGNRLDDSQRELIIKHFEAGTSIRKIVKLTGASQSTIQRLKRKYEQGEIVI
ncbi:helix-turn-helix domain-containing protein [Enterobacter pseudoroggenkampii]|uniref:helix-turn-helix domain-containing protein n=1 Tax=Enterobacter pseudoroggenkampii TaxID=2996112 RepID=UPI002265663D|nr:helix-turn-helix domain-containing protein [Enterobacter pseudoroggenkampii]MCX8289098.1 helix-turn-helix domain containing protein [Enterobacter pseudoroggenkampii]